MAYMWPKHVSSSEYKCGLGYGMLDDMCGQAEVAENIVGHPKMSQNDPKTRVTSRKLAEIIS